MADKKSDDVGREPEAMKKAHGALKDLTAEEQIRVLDWLRQKLNLTPASHQPGASLPVTQQAPVIPGGGPPPPTGVSQTPKVFLTQKKPQNNVERIVCLAYYLSKYKSTPHFKTGDLTKLNTDASQPRLTNPSQAVADATKSQHLTPAGGGKKQITTRGEALVEALPDREKVKAALAEAPVTRRRARKKGKKAA